MSDAPDLEEVWHPGRTVPLRGILGELRRGTGDPSMVIDGRHVWWAVTTPHGVAATWWSTRPVGDEGDAGRGDAVVLRAWGPGSSWFTGRLAGILGGDDDPRDFVAHHPRVEQALRARAHRDWRVPRTQLVITSLVPSILEQKVTGKQAFGAHRHLVRAFGTPARLPRWVVERSGPHAAALTRLTAPPDARAWRRIPSWEWFRAGVEPPQSRTVMRALEVAERLQETATMPLPDAHRRLRQVPGLGIWTTAKVAQTAWGDADAPTFADYHVAKQIGHAVLGRDVDDAGMARLLEPYRGHRYRAERLLLAGGFVRPRHGARMSLPTHLPTRAF